ncbi:MAG: hypothetical protein K9J27_11905 [Bacteroidales bacterium]|nr:hypothetical protein [Bacteroidales bacterium]MCF8334478.1 hypothetical protein [Bacteroidales bacterium]
MVYYIPILTTAVTAVFFIIIFRHWNRKRDALYLLWWTLGVFFYGAGTLTESLVSLSGWSPELFRLWYIVGAFLGGVPLAQGTVYLLMKRKTGHRLSAFVILIVAVGAVLVILTPVDASKAIDHKLTGNVMEWQFIRYMTPVINLYAFVFLVGGAIYSAVKYSKDSKFRGRFMGNVLIAIGGLLPGIGGSFTKFGHTEVLYITELVGIIGIFAGYWTIRNDPARSVYAAQKERG